MGRPAKVAAGFTLLELIVTLAVVAMAVAVVTPAIGRGTESLRARAEVASFAATLRHARERAITTQRPYRVTVDGDAHRMSVTTLPGPGSLATADAGPPLPLTPPATKTLTPPRVSTPGTSSSGTSSPSGTPAPSVLAREAEVNEVRTLSPQLVVESAKPSEIVFDVRGGATGGDFKLTSGGIAYRVTVDRLSGRVRSVRE